LPLDELDAAGTNFMLDDDEARHAAMAAALASTAPSRPWWKFWD
jgi:hypothetical protein